MINTITATLTIASQRKYNNTRNKQVKMKFWLIIIYNWHRCTVKIKTNIKTTYSYTNSLNSKHSWLLYNQLNKCKNKTAAWEMLAGTGTVTESNRAHWAVIQISTPFLSIDHLHHHHRKSVPPVHGGCEGEGHAVLESSGEYSVPSELLHEHLFLI